MQCLGEEVIATAQAMALAPGDMCFPIYRQQGLLLARSTITVTSRGALGGIVSTPIINAPKVAIVGVNRIVERPMLRGGAVMARQMMNLSSSFDHRVVDGVGAASFVQALRAYLKTPALQFIEKNDK